MGKNISTYSNNQLRPEDIRQITAYPIYWPIPPLQSLEQSDRFRTEAFSYFMGRNSPYNSIRSNIFRNQRPCSDNSSVSDMNAGENDGFITDPDIMTYNDISPVIPCLTQIFTFQSPVFIEQGKSVRR